MTYLENETLTEPQPKKAKLLCCIRKARLFYLMLDGASKNIESAVLVPSETPGE